MKPNDYVFVSDPRLLSTADNNAEAISKQAYNMLQARTEGPFRVITLQEMILKIDEHGTPQKISIICVTRAPDTINTNRHQLHEKLQHEIPLQQESSQKETPQDEEFVVDKIVLHISTEPQAKYVIRWYGYSP